MNKAKCDEQNYIHFLVVAQSVFNTVEAATTYLTGGEVVAYNAYTRLLQRLPPDSNELWVKVEGCIAREQEILIIDDSILDKSYASQMVLVTNYWSGKHLSPHLSFSASARSQTVYHSPSHSPLPAQFVFCFTFNYVASNFNKKHFVITSIRNMLY